MIYLLVGAIVMVVLTVIFLMCSIKSDKEVFFSFIIFTGFSAFILTIFLVANGWNWHKVGYKEQVINREFGTNYTQAEVFYADDVIDEIRQMNRQRIEINGNVMSGGNCQNE